MSSYPPTIKLIQKFTEALYNQIQVESLNGGSDFGGENNCIKNIEAHSQLITSVLYPENTLDKLKYSNQIAALGTKYRSINSINQSINELAYIIETQCFNKRDSDKLVKNAQILMSIDFDKYCKRNGLEQNNEERKIGNKIMRLLLLLVRNPVDRRGIARRYDNFLDDEYHFGIDASDNDNDKSTFVYQFLEEEKKNMNKYLSRWRTFVEEEDATDEVEFLYNPDNTSYETNTSLNAANSLYPPLETNASNCDKNNNKMVENNAESFMEVYRASLNVASNDLLYTEKNNMVNQNIVLKRRPKLYFHGPKSELYLWLGKDRCIKSATDMNIVSEADVCDALLWACLGCTSTYFLISCRNDVNGGTFWIRNKTSFSLSSTSCGSLGSLVDSFLEDIATPLSRIRDFCDLEKTCDSRVLFALKQSLFYNFVSPFDEAIRNYQKNLASFHKNKTFSILGRADSLIKLRSYIGEELEDGIRSCFNIVRMVENSNAKSNARVSAVCLNMLYSVTMKLQLSSPGLSSDKFNLMMQQIFDVYMNQLDDWIFTGTLDEKNRGELFFVVANNDNYYLPPIRSVDCIPHFLLSYEENIRWCGLHSKIIHSIDKNYAYESIEELKAGVNAILSYPRIFDVASNSIDEYVRVNLQSRFEFVGSRAIGALLLPSPDRQLPCNTILSELLTTVTNMYCHKDSTIFEPFVEAVSEVLLNKTKFSVENTKTHMNQWFRQGLESKFDLSDDQMEDGGEDVEYPIY